MNLTILNQYEQDGMQITEYTKDGVTAYPVVKVPIQTEPVEPEQVEDQSSVEEVQNLTYLNTEYLVTMSELQNL